MFACSLILYFRRRSLHACASVYVGIQRAYHEVAATADGDGEGERLRDTDDNFTFYYSVTWMARTTWKIHRRTITVSRGRPLRTAAPPGAECSQTTFLVRARTERTGLYSLGTYSPLHSGFHLLIFSSIKRLQYAENCPAMHEWRRPACQSGFIKRKQTKHNALNAGLSCTLSKTRNLFLTKKLIDYK